MEIDSLASRMSSTTLAEYSASSTGSIAVAEKGEQALGSWGCSSRPAMEAENYEAKCKLRAGVLHLDI